MLLNELSTMIAYLKDELTAEQELAVENRLAHDEEYAWIMECLHQKLIVEKGNEADIKELENIIVQEAFRLAQPTQILKEGSHKPVRSENEKIRSIRNWFYPLAATAAVILILFLIRYQGSNISTPEAEDYLTHYEDQIAYKGTSSHFQMRIDSAISFYRLANEKGYQQANPLLKKILIYPDSFPSSFDYEEVKLVYGISLLFSNQHKEAIDTLSSIMTNGGREQRYTAKWYLSLYYFSQNQSIDTVKLYFEDIATTPNPYQDKAQKMIENLSLNFKD